MLETLRKDLPFALMLGLSSCGPAQESGGAAAGTSESLRSVSAEPRPEQPRNRIGQGFGRVIDVDGDALVIEHGPLSGMAMGAMTMRFETVNAVAVAELAPGDEVDFRVKQGRDGVYRIMAVCRTVSGEATCLDESAVP